MITMCFFLLFSQILLFFLQQQSAPNRRNYLQQMNSQPSSESQSSNLLDGVHTSKTQQNIEPMIEHKEPIARQCPTFKVNIQIVISTAISILALSILVFIIVGVVHGGSPQDDASQEQMQRVKKSDEFPNWIGRKPKPTSTKSETLQHQLKLIRLQRQLLLLRGQTHEQLDAFTRPISQLIQQEDSTKINTWSKSSNSQQNKTNIVDSKVNSRVSMISKVIPSIERHQHFPRRVWMYIQEGIDFQTNITRLMVANMAEYLKKHGYDFQMIGEYNWHSLMSNQNEHSLGYVLFDLWHIAYQTETASNLRDHTFTIKKQLINLMMLSQMGGIVIDKQVLLMQDLSWLQNFNKINLNNKGKCEKPKVVGYYHINYTNLMEEVQISNYETKELHLYPPLDPYFLAVSRDGADFIKEVVRVYIDLLEFPEKTAKVIAQLNLNMGEIQGNDPYYQSYYVAFSSVIRKKQIQFDKEWQNSGYKKKRELAIDHYGIFSLNRVYGPLKYRYIFSNQQDTATYDFLSKLPYSKLQNQFGKADYLSFLPFPQKIQDLLVQAQEGNKNMLVDQESFFGRYLFNTVENKNWAIKAPLFPTQQVREGLVWKDLPRKLWVYTKEESYLNRLCFQSVRAAGVFSEFRVHELRDNHLMAHLSASVIKKIDEAIRAIPDQLDRKAIIELRVKLVKIATLQSQGGVWMELPAFPLEDFQWLKKIHANTDVLSKKRLLPEVVMFYHPLRSGFPFSCAGAKCSMKNNLELLPYFIAAKPKARLISMWLKEALGNLELSQSQLQRKFQGYGITISNSIGIKNYYEQTLLTVLRSQSAKIHNFADDSSAFDDFDVWLISSFNGPDKFKEYTNYDKGFSNNNTYLWGIPTPKAKRIMGQFRYFINLGDTASKFLNQKLAYHFFDLHIHPNSYLSKYLINSQQTFDYKALQLAKDSKSTQNILFPKIVWVYISSLHEISEYEEVWLRNTIHHGSDYIVQVVSQENYHEFIEDEMEIKELLRDVIPKLETSEQVREDIVEQLILYSLLKANGGMTVSSHCILAESLEWIHQVLDNPFRKELNSKYVMNIAFYSKKISRETDASEQQITESLRSYFLAASPNSNFIEQLTRSYILALHLVHKQIQYIPSLQQLNNQVFQLFYQSSKARDRALSYQTRMASIAKYYDMALLDSSLFGEKLRHYNKNQKVSLLSGIELMEMRDYIGPINYMLAAMDKEELRMIARIKKPVKYSFVNTFLNPEQQPQQQVKEVKKGGFNQSNFPYKVWFYKEMEDTPRLEQTKEVRLRLMCEQTDFSFMAIDDENIVNHIDQATQAIIAQGINKENKMLDSKIKSQLFKLALLIKEGGIFLSSNLIPIEGFNWIHHLPPKMQILSRIKQSPTLIHFFNDEWINFSIDKRYNLRIVDSSAISIQFLAATKGNNFLKDLFNQAIKIVSLDENTLKDQISKYAITQKLDQYSSQFLLKIAYRQVVQKKAKQLNIDNLKVEGLNLKEFTVVPQYYKVLALPLQHGPIKIINAIEDIGIKQIYNLVCHKQRVVFDQIYGSPRYFVKLVYRTFEGLEREGDEECEKDSYFSLYLLKGKQSD